MWQINNKRERKLFAKNQFGGKAHNLFCLLRRQGQPSFSLTLFQRTFEKETSIRSFPFKCRHNNKISTCVRSSAGISSERETMVGMKGKCFSREKIFSESLRPEKLETNLQTAFFVYFYPSQHRLNFSARIGNFLFVRTENY